jgi:hypothetical protein
MRSSILSTHTTRTCDTPYGTAEISRTLSATSGHSSRYRLPLPEESLPSQASLNNKRDVEAKPSLTWSVKLTSYLEDTGRKKTKGNKNSLIDKFWWPQTTLCPHTNGWSTQYPLVRSISGLTSITTASTPYLSIL